MCYDITIIIVKILVEVTLELVVTYILLYFDKKVRLYLKHDDLFLIIKFILLKLLNKK